MISHGLPNFDIIEISITDRSGKKRLIPTRLAGSGQPIVFLHGYPLDGRMWEPVMARLSDKFRCIAPDLRGFGASKEEALSFSMEDLAGDVYGLIRSLGVANKVTLCGLSMGGYVAMRFAEMYPESLGRLLLTNTRGNADDPKGRQIRIESAQKALAGQVEQVVSPMLEKLLTEKTRKHESELVGLVREMMLGTSPSTIAWAQLAMAARPDSLSTMKSWSIPTLCVAGAHDPITPPEAVQAMVEQIPNSKYELDSNSAHMTPLESPDWFGKKVADLFAI